MADVSEVKGRLQQVLAEYESNPTQLARQFKVNQKTLNNQINGTTDLSVSTILLILEAFPAVSSDWVLLGVGDMHKLPDGLDSPEDSEIARLETENEMLRSELVNLHLELASYRMPEQKRNVG